jgi:hypothetical protein
MSIVQLLLSTICQETEKPSLSFLEHFCIFCFPSLVLPLFLLPLSHSTITSELELVLAFI